MKTDLFIKVQYQHKNNIQNKVLYAYQI